MVTKEFENFTKLSSVSVGISAEMVCILQSSAGLSFHQHMTASQARELGHGLIAAAHELECMEIDKAMHADKLENGYEARKVDAGIQWEADRELEAFAQRMRPC
jgi:hypothetical protein